jgi:ribosome-associated heat shock protein Hsp15
MAERRIEPNVGGEPQRLDSWLDVSCVFKTRSAATRACNGGKVAVNGVRGKPHKAIRPGDSIDVTLERGRRRILRVVSTCQSSIPRAQARTLYEDLTPAPSPEELEARLAERLSRPSAAPGRPASRDRRALIRLKGR